MSHRINKKQAASLAGVSTKTMNRNKEDFAFLNKCKMPGTKRATFDRDKVEREMRNRGMI